MEGFGFVKHQELSGLLEGVLIASLGPVLAIQ